MFLEERFLDLEESVNCSTGTKNPEFCCSRTRDNSYFKKNTEGFYSVDNQSLTLSVEF